MRSPTFPANTEQRCQAVYDRWRQGRRDEPEHWDCAGLALLLSAELALIDPEILDWVKTLPDERRQNLQVIDNTE